MKGYLYIMSTGSDPGQGWYMNDPDLNNKVPTLGACMPNVRRLVNPGDYIFVVSGSVPEVQQYVVGGLQVAEKINALEAYARLPQNRMKKLQDGSIHGNIIVDEFGTHHPLDGHIDFENRVENYIIGKDPLSLTNPEEIERSRSETLPMLEKLFGAKGGPPISIMGRWRKLNPRQIEQLREWLEDIRG